MSKNKFYVVWQGSHPGIYDRWEDCKKEIEGVKGAKYKGFPDRTSAETAFKEGPDNYWGKEVSAPVVDLSKAKEQPVSPAVAVDAACSGNPGKMEYQGLFVDFGTQPATTVQLFKSPVFENGTNNIGEFLAIVHALALFANQGNDHTAIYSDSKTAMSWIRAKQCRTKLARTDANARLFDIIARAERWLATHTCPNAILKWNTAEWGEIPADFGRK